MLTSHCPRLSLSGRTPFSAVLLTPRGRPLRLLSLWDARFFVGGASHFLCVLFVDLATKSGLRVLFFVVAAL